MVAASRVPASTSDGMRVSWLIAMKRQGLDGIVNPEKLSLFFCARNFFTSFLECFSHDDPKIALPLGQH
jgi:hypothetical protein